MGSSESGHLLQSPILQSVAGCHDLGDPSIHGESFPFARPEKQGAISHLASYAWEFHEFSPGLLVGSLFDFGKKIGLFGKQLGGLGDVFRSVTQFQGP